MSKIDEKLEHFTNDIMSDVGEERRSMLDAVDKELKEKLEKEETNYLSKAYELIQDALIRIDQEKNEQMSKAVMDNKIRQIRKRNELIDGMFEEAKDKLRAYTKTEPYVEQVAAMVDSAKTELGDGELVVILNATDAEIVDEIRKRTQLEVILESRKVDFIGGCKVMNKTKNRIIDDSFLRKLNDQKDDFIFRCHLDVE